MEHRARSDPLRAALFAVLLAGCTSRPAEEPAAAYEPLTVGIQAVILSDDDGRRRAEVYAEEIDVAVELANRVYRPAAVRFAFEPATDVTELRSTLLNSLGGGGSKAWLQAKRAGAEVASHWPDRIVAFYRHGPREEPTGGGFSWSGTPFVVMPGFAVDAPCGERQSSALAHEIGHYLGLPHTFPGVPFPSVPEAVRSITERGVGPESFDGDGFDDTAPDPAIRTLECEGGARLVLAGQRYLLPRDNIMSYYRERRTISPRQAQRVRWVLERRMRSGMRLHAAGLPDRPLEIESLRHESPDGCRASVRSTWSYGAGDWSGDRQLLVRAGDGCELWLTLPVKAPGS